MTEVSTCLLSPEGFQNLGSVLNMGVSLIQQPECILCLAGSFTSRSLSVLLFKMELVLVMTLWVGCGGWRSSLGHRLITTMKSCDGSSPLPFSIAVLAVVQGKGPIWGPKSRVTLDEWFSTYGLWPLAQTSISKIISMTVHSSGTITVMNYKITTISLQNHQK